MEKFAISFTIMIVMLLLSFSIVQISNTQSNNFEVAAPTTLANYTKIFGENKEYQVCYSVLEPEE